MVCGDQVIDLDLMKRHTVYVRPFEATHPKVKMFWRVMESFSNEERCVLFLSRAGFVSVFKPTRSLCGVGAVSCL